MGCVADKTPPLAAFLVRMRAAKGWTQKEISERTGLGVNTISSHENGHTAAPRSLRKLYAAAYGYKTVDDFDDEWRPSAVKPGTRRVASRGSPSGRIPVINLAPAGTPRNYEECFSDSGVGFEYIDRTPGLPDGDLFAFVVVGDSMIPDFQEGDYVVCLPAELPEVGNGEPVFVRFGHEHEHTCTFKRIFRAEDDRIELRPDNRRHPLTLCRAEEIVRLGAVVEVRRRTKWAGRARSGDDSTSQIGADDE